LAAAGFALALWLATVVLGACPKLHHWLHKDSEDPQHYCVFTQLNQDSVLTSFAPTLAPEPPQVAAQAQLFLHCEPLLSFDYAVSHGRAPPLLVSATAVVG
jgi:hypothetical protein